MALVLAQALLGALQVAACTLSTGRRWFPPSPWTDAIAATLLAVASGVGVAAAIALRRSFRVHPRPRPDGYLVRAGVYSVLRHPMYLTVLLVVVASFLRWPSTASAAATLANLGFYLAKARYEERLLLAHYPDYREYRARTWGIAPWGPRGR